MNSTTLLLGNIIGAILQPLYSCLFVLYTKKLNKHRSLFVILTIIDYIVINLFIRFRYGVNADLIFVIMFYINLKLIYKQKARVTDIITYIVSDILLGIISMSTYFLFGMNIVSLIIATTLPILIIYLIRDKLNVIDKFYDKHWNRKENNIGIKSITVRGISACLTIFSFIILHFWIIYLLLR